jgi:hypothetical protein
MTVVVTTDVAAGCSGACCAPAIAGIEIAASVAAADASVPNTDRRPVTARLTVADELLCIDCS